MAKTWHYSRWRRALMQGTMWLLLGAAVALAALVNSYRRAGLSADLAPARRIGQIDVRLPAQWALNLKGENATQLAVLKEPAGRQRTLLLLQQRTGALISPLEYLYRSGVMDHGYIDQRQPVAQLQPLTIDGFPGLLVVGRQVLRRGSRQILYNELFASVVLPSHLAITLKLESIGPPTAADVRLISQIAESVRFADEPALDRGPTSAVLSNGLKVALPPAMHLVPSTDPNRCERQALLLDDSGLWISMDIVPLWLEPQKSPGQLPAILALQDPAWRNGSISDRGAGRWAIDAPDTGPTAAAFPTRAYVLGMESGQGLAVIFHGGPEAEARFEDLWRALAADVSVAQSFNYDALLASGREQARKLRQTGLARLLGDEVDEQWWLLYNENQQHYQGWSHVEFPSGGRKSFKRETRWLSWDQTVDRTQQLWSGNDQLSEYASVTNISQAGRQLDDQFVARGRRSLLLRDGKLSITPPNHPRIAPEEYIPGGWLALVLGQVGDEPMIIRTDSMIGYESGEGDDLLALLVQPCPAPAGPATSTQPATTKPTRCLSVQVNGSGQISRWFFDADGQLRQIDFAGGFRRIRCPQQDVQNGFAADGRLAPPVE